MLGFEVGGGVGGKPLEEAGDSSGWLTLSYVGKMEAMAPGSLLQHSRVSKLAVVPRVT